MNSVISQLENEDDDDFDIFEQNMSEESIRSTESFNMNMTSPDDNALAKLRNDDVVVEMSDEPLISIATKYLNGLTASMLSIQETMKSALNPRSSR